MMAMEQREAPTTRPPAPSTQASQLRLAADKARRQALAELAQNPAWQELRRAEELERAAAELDKRGDS